MSHTIHRPSLAVRLATLAGGIALASVLPAQTANWFPLEAGNAWLYRPAETNNRFIAPEFRSILVQGMETIAGRDYFKVSYFGYELLLRVDSSDGSVWLFDKSSGSEKQWLAPGLPVGGTFPAAMNPCPTTGSIASRDATARTPAGTFEHAVQVKFQGNCADVGATEQYYAPDVGLVMHEETTLAGPLRFELVYYRVASGTSSAQEVAFTVALNAAQYAAGDTLRARLTLRNTTSRPIALHFPSGQSYDLRVLDARGNVVDSWSKDKLFVIIVRDESFGPGEKTYGVTLPLSNLRPGRYIAEAYLTTDPVTYGGKVSFEIVGEQGARFILSPHSAPSREVYPQARFVTSRR
jgi:intracellular proteinase inhibitor BsuPI